MSRRRQANGCPNRVNVSLTDEQHKKWKALADADSITLQRWIVNRVLDRPPTMINRALVAEVSGIRYEANGAFGNLNQIAKRAHVEGVDLRGWLYTVALIAWVVQRAEQWITEHK